MPEAKHTPGPWDIGSSLGDDPNRRVPVLALSDTGRSVLIANCGGSPREANARLIAAAPELLGAAVALEALSIPGTDGIMEEAFTALRAAIAKAEGDDSA